MIVHYQDQNEEKVNNQIPLPSTPPAPVATSMPLGSLPKLSRKSSYRSLETVDSFEILEQTIMKQKRLGKSKNTDLRTKVLLKRTFNLVCEMMDEENGLENNLLESDTQDKDEICQNTLIINLNESETLDLFQNEENDVQNFIELENFNYENLLENEQTECLELDKNKSFLTVNFFDNNSCTKNQELENEEEENDSSIHYSCFKRRRSSDDDDDEFEDLEENYDKKDQNIDNFNYLSDLTNSSSQKRPLKYIEIDLKQNNPHKKFKESFNIVT